MYKINCWINAVPSNKNLLIEVEINFSYLAKKFLPRFSSGAGGKTAAKGRVGPAMDTS